MAKHLAVKSSVGWKWLKETVFKLSIEASLKMLSSNDDGPVNVMWVN